MEGIKDIRMFNKLPYNVNLQGKNYKINADYRVMISFENVLRDKTLTKSQKIERGLRMFYPLFFYPDEWEKVISNPSLYKEACEKLLWFYKCGDREDYHKTSGEGKGSSEKILDFKYDDEYVFSAFYFKGIDLTTDYLHWWKFKAIFKSLHDETINRIMEYRSYSGKDEDMKKKKEYWKLPEDESEKERLEALYEALK